MGNPVVHFEIYGKDGDALERFYGSLFEWGIAAPNANNYREIQTGEGQIHGGIGVRPDGNGFVSFYVAVDDVQSYLTRAEKLGGKTVLPVTRVTDEYVIAMFADPEGHLIGLVRS